MKEQTPNLDPTRIINTASAFYDSCALFTASDLGVFGKLAELGEADTEKIASECGLNNRGTRLLLDSCVALGLLHKTGQVYRNSEEVNTFLVPGSPADLSKAIRYNRFTGTSKKSGLGVGKGVSSGRREFKQLPP